MHCVSLTFPTFNKSKALRRRRTSAERATPPPCSPCTEWGGGLGVSSSSTGVLLDSHVCLRKTNGCWLTIVIRFNSEPLFAHHYELIRLLRLSPQSSTLPIQPRLVYQPDSQPAGQTTNASSDTLLWSQIELQIINQPKQGRSLPVPGESSSSASRR